MMMPIGPHTPQAMNMTAPCSDLIAWRRLPSPASHDASPEKTSIVCRPRRPVPWYEGGDVVPHAKMKVAAVGGIARSKASAARSGRDTRSTVTVLPPTVTLSPDTDPGTMLSSPPSNAVSNLGLKLSTQSSAAAPRVGAAASNQTTVRSASTMLRPTPKPPHKGTSESLVSTMPSRSVPSGVRPAARSASAAASSATSAVHHSSYTSVMRVWCANSLRRPMTDRSSASPAPSTALCPPPSPLSSPALQAPYMLRRRVPRRSSEAPWYDGGFVSPHAKMMSIAPGRTSRS
mmetsp:Transcript_4139/g.15297  ORF Transcript_4139/g.15297 Transcript_4139/m.15297 type:complete len:289 (+) Transcript_4139:1922-2788(+)